MPLAERPLAPSLNNQGAGVMVTEPQAKHVLAAFGVIESSLPTTTKPLSATSSTLALLGIAFTDDGRGVAIFAEQDKAPQAYSRGARLPHGAIIESISPDKVVVSIEGVLSEFAAPARPPTLAISPPKSLPPLPKLP
jgi:type II secretory pathway component PulC